MSVKLTITEKTNWPSEKPYLCTSRVFDFYVNGLTHISHWVTTVPKAQVSQTTIDHGFTLISS